MQLPRSLSPVLKSALQWNKISTKFDDNVNFANSLTSPLSVWNKYVKKMDMTLSGLARNGKGNAPAMIFQEENEEAARPGRGNIERRVRSRGTRSSYRPSYSHRCHSSTTLMAQNSPCPTRIYCLRPPGGAGGNSDKEVANSGAHRAGNEGFNKTPELGKDQLPREDDGFHPQLLDGWNSWPLSFIISVHLPRGGSSAWLCVFNQFSNISGFPCYGWIGIFEKSKSTS